MKRKLILSATCIAGALSFNTAKAESIGFDAQGLTGPSTFAAAGPAQTLNITTDDSAAPLPGTVTFTGGVILTQTANLPANQTSIYGTANPYGDNLSNPLTITFAFPNPIQNFFLDVLNGNVQDIDYRVADNAGNSADFTLVPNLNSGAKTIGFAATGTVVTITSVTPGPDFLPFDFFVDNIHFNEALPNDLQMPDSGSTLSLLAGGTLLFGAIRRRITS